METVSFPENIDWCLLFLAEASYYKGKSWRVIDGSIQPGESKPTVFGAAKPTRRGGKFRNCWTVRHYYRSFQHRNELLLNKVSCFTMKTCDFYRSDDILTNTAIRAYSLTLWKIWKYMIISTQLSNNSLISLNDVWWAPMMGLKKSEREPTFDFGCGHLGFQGPVSRKSR